MALTYKEGTREIDIDCLKNIKNEDGTPLSEKQIADYKKAIETNGLAGLSENGTMVMIHPVAHTLTSNDE